MQMVFTKEINDFNGANPGPMNNKIAGESFLQKTILRHKIFRLSS